MKNIKKAVCLILSLICALFVPIITANAQTSDYMNNMDKGYVTFVFDDNRSCTAELYELFSKYNMPLSCAVIASSVENNASIINTLTDIQNAGGEILSHTYTHRVFTGADCDLTVVEEEFQKSYNTLTSLGFNVNGIIETGNGGDEANAPKDQIENITKKYYKYSNGYGVSPQFKATRIWLSAGLKTVKDKVNSAAQNNEWLILSAHDFNEMGKAALEALLQYISEKENIEVVTWNYMYRTFGTNPDSITPTNKVESVTEQPQKNDTDIDAVTKPDSEPTQGAIPDTSEANTDNSANADNVQSDSGTNGGYHVFIIIAVILLLAALAVTAIIIIKKKRNRQY